MGVFNQKSKFKPAPTILRKEVVVVETPPKPRPRPVATSSTPNSGLRVPAAGTGATAAAKLRRATPTASPRASPSLRGPSASPYPPSSDEKASRKRKAPGGALAHRPSPASDRVEFDADSSGSDDDDWEAALDARKRHRRNGLNGDRHIDKNRRLAHPVLAQIADKTDGKGPRELRIIHAAEVASLDLKCVPVLGAAAEDVGVALQYPGSRTREKYQLVWGRDKIDAVKDIKLVVKYVADMYLTDSEAKPFLDQTTGIVRQLERASSDQVKDFKGFKAAVKDYNRRLLALVESGAIAKNLGQRHDVPSNLVAFILDQVYDRIVAPKVELLSKYQNGSDNVYGELLHPFITSILIDRCKMTSDQVFVDLGSGVGNVVLQAALEIGCESWGCEMMENACNLAEAQKKEFAERCRLWGIAPGKVHLERGDFRAIPRIQEALQRADVVLVNNQAFTSQLNDDLVRMFLDLKPGCQIVSLKSFVHDHKSASYNINDVGSTILEVEDLTYPEGYVSWTGAGGTYCISKRK